MFSTVAFFAVCAATLFQGIEAGTCGQGKTPNKVKFLAGGIPFKRIIGGDEAAPHSIPWIVSIQMKNLFIHHCGASLIRVSDKEEISDILVTAAHCFDGGTNELSLEAILGGHALKKKGEALEPGAQRIKFASRGLLTHPQYGGQVINATKQNPSYVNDIAILKLATPVAFSDTIQPVCLPTQGEQLSAGAQGIAAGWGHEIAGGNVSPILRQVVLPFVPRDDCKKVNLHDYVDNPSYVCAGGNGKGTCQTDSGGPFAVQQPQGFVLYGLVSHAAGCGAVGYPTIFTNVANYADWIKLEAGKLTSVGKTQG